MRFDKQELPDVVIAMRLHSQFATGAAPRLITTSPLRSTGITKMLRSCLDPRNVFVVHEN